MEEHAYTFIIVTGTGRGEVSTFLFNVYIENYVFEICVLCSYTFPLCYFKIVKIFSSCNIYIYIKEIKKRIAPNSSTNITTDFILHFSYLFLFIINVKIFVNVYFIFCFFHYIYKPFFMNFKVTVDFHYFWQL